jgi:hypothetical protein
MGYILSESLDRTPSAPCFDQGWLVCNITPALDTVSDALFFGCLRGHGSRSSWCCIHPGNVNVCHVLTIDGFCSVLGLSCERVAVIPVADKGAQGSKKKTRGRFFF